MGGDFSVNLYPIIFSLVGVNLAPGWGDRAIAFLD